MKFVVILILAVNISLVAGASSLDDQLFEAIDDGDINLLLTLLEQGANIHAVDSDGLPLLHRVIELPYSLTDFESISKTIPVLLDYGLDVNVRDREGNTALHYGIMMNIRHELIVFLIDNHADVTLVNNEGKNALHHATAYFNMIDIIRLLCEKGAGPDIRDFYGYTPIDIARGWGNTGAVEYLETLEIEVKPEQSGTLTVGLEDNGQGNILLNGQRLDLRLEPFSLIPGMYNLEYHSKTQISRKTIRIGAGEHVVVDAFPMISREYFKKQEISTPAYKKVIHEKALNIGAVFYYIAAFFPVTNLCFTSYYAHPNMREMVSLLKHVSMPMFAVSLTHLSVAVGMMASGGYRFFYDWDEPVNQVLFAGSIACAGITYVINIIATLILFTPVAANLTPRFFIESLRRSNRIKVLNNLIIGLSSGTSPVHSSHITMGYRLSLD